MNTKNFKIELKKVMHEKHINGKQLAELAEISEGDIVILVYFQKTSESEMVIYVMIA